MFINYFKTAIRNIYRNKFYSIVNVLGLSVGIAVFLLIYFFIQYEFNFDKHIPKAHNIFRITTDMIWENGDVQHTAMSPPPTAPTLHENYPEVLAATRFIIDNSMMVERTSGGKSPQLVQNYEEVFYIDDQFSNVFQLNIIQGSLQSVFDISKSILLSRSMAEKYFQQEDPLGKILTLNNKQNYLVKAVFDDLPANTHFNFQFLVNATDEPDFQSDQWRSMSTYSYVLLDNNTKPQDFEEKLVAFKDTYLEPWKDLMDFKVQPMLDIHLRNTKEFEMAKTSNLSLLLIVMGIAFLILLIAAINYMNLSVARSLVRSKEVGLRKVVGASKKMIITQFLGESILLSFVALVTGIVLTEFLMPGFNSFVQAGISPDYMRELWKLLLLAIFLGLLTGSYPAFYLSSFQPAKVLKGRSGSATGGKLLKKILVIFQFAVSILLLIGTMTIYLQFSFIRKMDLGFDKDVTMNIFLWNDSTGVYAKKLKNDIEGVPGVQKIALSDHVPGNEAWFEHFWPEDYESHMPLRTANINPDYIPTLGIELVAGRNFSNDFGLDTASCILNEAAVRHLGWTNENSIGRIMKYNFSNDWDDMITAHVIGVVRDYHYQSLHVQVEPVVLTMHKKYYPILSVRLGEADLQQTISAIEEEYNGLNYAFPFDYAFLDNQVEEMYVVDQKVGQLLIWFSLLSVFIACLGLLGLTSFTIQRRTREIGVRKVFGASVKDIITIFTGEFTNLLLIASVIAIPLGWFAMDLYLQQFAYRIIPAWWIFPLAAIVSFGWAIGLVSFQAYKYTFTNPAEVLKWE